MTDQERAHMVFLTSASREMGFLSGRARFKYQIVGDVSQLSTMLFGAAERNEARDGAFIDFVWDDMYQWTIGARDISGRMIREIISCRDQVECAGTIWPSSYLTDICDTFEKELFRDAMWPFIIASKFHLFPITHGRLWGSDEIANLSASMISSTCEEPERGRIRTVSGFGLGRRRSRHFCFLDTLKSLSPYRRKSYSRKTEIPYWELVYEFTSATDFLPLRHYGGALGVWHQWIYSPELTCPFKVPSIFYQRYGRGDEQDEVLSTCELLSFDGKLRESQGGVQGSSGDSMRDCGSTRVR